MRSGQGTTVTETSRKWEGRLMVSREARSESGGGFKGYVLMGRGDEEVILMSWSVVL